MSSIINNEDVFSYLLSFLSTQDKVNIVNAQIGYSDSNHKLNSELVKVCCRNCSFDNIAVQFGICTYCITSIDKYNSFEYISYEDANRLYKFSNKKLDIEILNSQVQTKTVFELSLVLYNRLDIQRYVDSNFISNKERLLTLYKKRIAKEKRDIVNSRKKEKEKEEELKRKEKEKKKKSNTIYEK